MDNQTSQLLAEVREVAARHGLTARPVGADEFQEMGRRARLRNGYRFRVTRSAPGVPERSRLSRSEWLSIWAP